MEFRRREANARRPLRFPRTSRFARIFIPSPGAHTSSVTVFIIPPRYVALKVGDQLLGRGEGVTAFLAAEVPMIAFTCFVVEPQNALAVYDVSEPILEGMIRSGKGFRYSPEN